MKIVVTGGAGYIGTELINVLISDPQVEKIVVYDNLSRMNYNLFLGQRLHNHAKVAFVKGELLDSRNLRKVLQGIDVVYHLAAKVTSPITNTDGHVYEQVNHWGTAELVYAVEESEVKRFIFASSTGVYGASDTLIDERTPAAPKTLYAVSKLRGEEHVRRLINKIDTYILRCGNVYGYSKSMRFDAVINKFTFEANFDKRITIQGNGKQSRSFINVELLARALANLLTANISGGTYNLVERNLKVFDVVDALKELVPSLEFLFVNQHLQLHDLHVAPNAVLNKALGVQNTSTLKEELALFLDKFSF